MMDDIYQRQLDEELIEACKVGDLEKIKYLLTSADIDDRANINPQTWHTPLGEACWNGHLEIVKFLLTSPDLKVHADMFDSDSRSLVYAAYNGHLDIVKYLLTSSDLEQYININEREEDRVLDTACSNNHLKIVRFLMESTEMNQIPDRNSLERAIQSCFQEKSLPILQYFIFLEHTEILSIIKEQLLEFNEEFAKEVNKLVEQQELILVLNSELQPNNITKKAHKL